MGKGLGCCCVVGLACIRAPVSRAQGKILALQNPWATLSHTAQEGLQRVPGTHVSHSRKTPASRAADPMPQRACPDCPQAAVSWSPAKRPSKAIPNRRSGGRQLAFPSPCTPCACLRGCRVLWAVFGWLRGGACLGHLCRQRGLARRLCPGCFLGHRRCECLWVSHPHLLVPRL